MLRMSSLPGRPVILGQRRLGLLQNVLVDAAQKRVRALIVGRGFLGKCVVLPEAIVSITQDFMLVDGTRRFDRRLEPSGCLFVRDTQGLLVGRVTDFALEDGAVVAAEICGGYGKAAPRFWCYRFYPMQGHPDELMIPALLGRELIHSSEVKKHANVHDEEYCGGRYDGPDDGRWTDDDAAGQADEKSTDEKRPAAGQTAG